jgi:hypothetical protein
MSQRRTESGSALLMAMFMVVLLVTIGTALLFLGQNELSMARSTFDEAKAFQLAEAGVEAARMTLLGSASDGFDDDLAAAAGGNSSLDLDPARLRATYSGLGVLSGLAGDGDDTPIAPLALLADADTARGYYAAYLTNDPVEGLSALHDVNQRVMITAIGVSQNRVSEVVQAIVEPRHPLPSVPTAALTLLGPAPVFDNGTSTTQSHTGEDCPAGGGIPGLYVPIVGTTSDAAQQQVQDDMHRPSTFVSGSLTGEDTVGDLTDPSDPAMAQSGLPPVDPAWVDCHSLKDMVLDLIAGADYYCDTDSATCTLPAGHPGEVLVVDGDATAGAFSAGILVVTGQLTYSGSSAWNGIVLVVGEGRLHRSSGGSGQSAGAVIVANIDPTPSGPNADKGDWCDSDFGPAEYTAGGGGNSSISYCSATVESANPLQTLRVSEFLER